MYALAEINTCVMGGALTAAAVQSGHLRQLSLGYRAMVQASKDSGGELVFGQKRIHELSIVERGARPNYNILSIA